jgi:tetratricopeptide (TPR) repeat protein
MASVSLLWPSQNQTIADNTRIQEKKIIERIARMKADPKNPFFFRSDLTVAEQEAIAKKHIEAIKKLLQAEPQDADKILAQCYEILRLAPAAPSAQMAHWNIHSYLLLNDDRVGARDALETYLAKYQASDSQKKEAYDKLAMIAAKSEDWGAALYYAEKYLSLDPSSWALMLTKARGLVKAGARGDGEKLLNKIIAEAPGSVQATLAQDDLNKVRAGSQPPGLVAKYEETLQRLREIVLAVESFRIVKDKLPGSLSVLVPDYLPKLVEADAWGNKLIVQIDPKNNTYRIASAGSDGRFAGFDQKGEYSDLAGKDIIFADGVPVFVPKLGV